MDQANASVHPSPEAAAPGLKAGLKSRQGSSLARRLVLASLNRIREGHLELVCPGGTFQFGDPSSTLRARAVIHDERAFALGATQGEVGLGEAYTAGYWSSEDLVAVVRLAVRNMAAFDRGGGLLASLGRLLNRLRHRRRENDISGARANIAHHYDLGNDFYQLWLDPTLAYSCAIFEHEGEDLESAQLRKFDRICRKLRLQKEDHLLEIGTGWGGFSAYAAERYGCRVTTTTISRQQHDHAKALFRARGLEGRVELLFEDYRHLRGSYDKAVSIEMFEAVGLAYYDAYFAAVDRLLKPGGSFLLQTITMNERRFPTYIRSTDWIQKHIFPGAELASVSEVLKSTARATDLCLFHLEDIGSHYARTLAAWRQRFWSAVDQVRALGYDEAFVRMWDFYLAYCEGAFAERYIGDAQILLAKAGTPQPLLDEPW